MRNFLKIAVSTLLTTCFIGGSAFAQKVPREKTVIFDHHQKVNQPYNHNPMTPGRNIDQGVHQAVYEPLFILNYETGDIEDWLGTSFTSNEAMDVWTLKIRKGVTWSDGEAYDADDVVYTINLLKNDDTASLHRAASMQEWVKSVEKTDQHTVVFNLTKPNARFQLDYFAIKIWGDFIILTEHIWKDKDPFTFTFYDLEKSWPLGTGPYKLTNATPTEFIFDRDDNWWGNKAGFKRLPEPHRLIWSTSGTEENRALMATRNELDSAHDMTLGAFEAIMAKNPKWEAWWDDMPYSWLDPCARQMSINNTIEPWNDPEMRVALNHIIDRDEIVRVAYEGTTFASKSMFVQYAGMDRYINAICDAGLCNKMKGDVQSAQKIIESKGWQKAGNGFYEKDGKTLTFEIKTHEAYIEKRRIADVVVEQFRKAGIKADQRPIAGATWDNDRKTGNFVASMDWHTCRSVNEPYASMNRMTDKYLVPVGQASPGDNNFVRWDTANSKKYSEIVDKMGAMPLNAPGMETMVVDAYKLLIEEMPFISITQARKLIPFNTTYWEGWPRASNNYNHPATWWQSTHHIIHQLTPAK